MDQTLSQIIHNYLKSKENVSSFSPLTLKAYEIDLKQAFENKLNIVCKYEEIWSFARNTLSQWGHLSLSSRNRKIATLKSFFGWLYDEKLLDRDYSNQLICPKIPKKIPHFISVDEAIAILKHLNSALSSSETDKLTARLVQQKTLFLLLYGCGLRISEACNLKWKDVNLKQQKILVLGKGNKERYSVIPGFSLSLLSALEEKAQANKSPYIFGDEALNPRAGYELIRTLGKQAGLINSLNPHALRHSYATHLLASGTNLRTLQSLLGHESLQATEKYTHLSVDHLARLVEQTHPLKKLKLTS